MEIEVTNGKRAEWIDGVLTLVDQRPTEKIKTPKSKHKHSNKTNASGSTVPNETPAPSLIPGQEMRFTFLANKAKRAELTTTSKGLKVLVHIENKTYQLQRKINDDYEYRLANQVVFREKLPKWNYLIKYA